MVGSSISMGNVVPKYFVNLTIQHKLHNNSCSGIKQDSGLTEITYTPRRNGQTCALTLGSIPYQSPQTNKSDNLVN
jgi:hypothetical protein